MSNKEVSHSASQTKTNRILRSFSTPSTPKQVERKLGIKKFKVRPYLKRDLIHSLNPEGRKGRFYLLTDKGRKLLNLPVTGEFANQDWDLIGWVMASPRQRLVVIKTMAIDSAKRTSEEIRKRASRLNSCLSRMSTKTILNELIGKGLVETEMSGVYRLYWLSDLGKTLAKSISDYRSSSTN